MIYIRLFIILFLSAVTIPVYAARNISLPFAEDFDSNDYSDLLWTSQGATHTWLSSGGWSGGAAKFTPCVTNEGYSGLGQFLGLSSENTTTLNIRFLIYYGTTYQEYASNTKLIVSNRTDNVGPRPSIYDSEWVHTTPYFVGLAPCSNTVCQWDNDVDGGYWIHSTDRFKIGDRSDGLREGEWISVEMGVDLTAGTIKLYIYTLDEEFNGLYLTQTTDTGNTYGYVDIIGGYFSPGGTADVNNYFLIDELEMSTSYIGPPAGFVTGEEVPENAIQGMQISNLNVTNNLIAWHRTDGLR